MPWAGIISFAASLTLTSTLLYFSQINELAKPVLGATSIISPIASGYLPMTPSPYPTPSPTPSPSPTPPPKTILPTPIPKPSSTPQPTPTPLTSEQFENWFTQYAGAYSIDRELLKKIAICESQLNPNARNRDYGGLYQFSSSTWNSTRRTMNHDTNPDLRFNAEESIKTAAFRLSTSGSGAWPNCSK